MKDFKGTPGPWVVEVGEYVMDEDGNCIAAFGGWHANDKDEANANLCAAAPELLEALQDMLSGWKYIRQTHGDLYGVGWDRAEQKANLAIARALGQ